MKHRMVLLVTVLAALAISTPSVIGQTSNRTFIAYQGRLQIGGGTPDPGARFDIDFRLFDAATGGNLLAQLCEPYVPVDNGLFSVLIDFPPGPTIWNDDPRWLEIAVRPATNNSTAPFTLLSPRQRVSPVPTALHAQHAEVANTFTGTVAVAQLPAGVARLDTPQTFTAVPSFMPSSGAPFTVLGTTSRVDNLNADLLDGLDSTAFWRWSFVDGVAAGVAPVDLPVEIRVQNTRVLRLERGLTVPNLIGGSSANTITPGVSGSVITGGGGTTSPNSIAANGGFIGAGLNNRINANADHSVVAGGNGNQIGTGARESIIGGGANHRIGSNSINAGIFSGSANEVMANSRFAGVLLGANSKVCEHSDFAAVLSGQNQVVDEDAPHSVIAGGAANVIQEGAHSAFVGGGHQNLVSTGAFLSVIVGGQANQIGNGAYRSAVVGGNNNAIGPASYNAFLGGGGDNKIEFNAPYSAILGGNLNVVRTNAGWATVLGGLESVAGAPFAIAAGHGAKAQHSGSIVLADGQYATFASSNANEFAVRAAGGVRFVTAGAGLFVDGQRMTNGSGGATIPDGSVTSAKLADGSTLSELLDDDGFGSGLDADQLDGLDSSAFAPASHHHDNSYWRQGGNSGTLSGLSFMGTTDNQPLSFRVNNLPVLRLEPRVSPNIIGGHSLNFASSGVYGATISGGGTNGFPNWVADHYGTVGGGRGNAASGEGSIVAGGFRNDANGINSTVGGGQNNTANGFGGAVGGGVNNYIGTDSDYSVIGGGSNNNIAANAPYAMIAGGDGNGIRTNSDYSAIGGGNNNDIAANAQYATIAGGVANYIGVNSDYSAIGGGGANVITADSLAATLAGGFGNVIQTNSDHSAIGGGEHNRIAANAPYATIAGGADNAIGTNADNSAIGGGRGNTIADNASSATIAGGNNNNISTTSFYGTIGGGVANNIADYAFYATIPGGYLNAATNYAFAAGHRAKANHQGAFVWADSSAFDFPSTASRQFNVRAVGGVRFVTGIDGSGVPDAGVSLNANDTSWNVISDRAAKKNFRPADGLDILERLARLPVHRWNYKWEADDAVPHLGPVAQDFKAAFYPGRDGKTISTLEFDGVALAAIQGLNLKLEQTLKEKEARIETLEKRLEKLEQLVTTLTQTGGAQ